MPAEAIAEVEWSYVELRRSEGRWNPRLKVDMPRLDGLNRNEFEAIITVARDVDELDRLLRKHLSQAAGRRDPVMEVALQLAPSVSSRSESAPSESGWGNGDS